MSPARSPACSTARIGKDVGKLTSQVLDQRAELRGKVVVHSRPALTANWRLEPNLTSQVALADSAVTLAGLKINVASEAKPLIDREVNAQIASLQTRLRNDPFIERAARAQWAKMCRSIPLGGDKTGLPGCGWRCARCAPPPRSRRSTAATSRSPSACRPKPASRRRQTKPDLSVPGAARTGAADGERQASRSACRSTCRSASSTSCWKRSSRAIIFPTTPARRSRSRCAARSIAAAGDRLLISLRVKAHEKKSWFGFGAEATVHIWGKPALDAKNQMLRLTDLSLAVESEAAYGLLGAAARAAMPYLQQALADNAVIDLKPFAADAKKKIGLALADFQKNSEGVRVDHRGQRPAPHRHRLRFGNAARDRGSRRQRRGGGERVAEDVSGEAVIAGLVPAIHDAARPWQTIGSTF